MGKHPHRVSCLKNSCNQRYQDYRETLKKLEATKHERELAKQKETFEEKLKTETTSLNNRMLAMR
jgi:hypothetical protein